MNKVTTPFYIFTIIILISFTQGCIQPADDDKDQLLDADKKQIGYTIDTALVAHFNKNSSTEILDKSTYQEFYDYIDQISNDIATTAYLTTVPEIRLIHSTNETKTAFAGIDGYLYIYTDLLKTLDYESQLVGILSCLMACDESEKPLQKLQERFFNSYLIDLALGGTLDNIVPVLDELQDSPYDSLWVNTYDEKSILVLCTEGYNIQGYSDLFSLQSNIKWMQQYPRPNNFAATLFNRHNNSDCGGTNDNATVYQTMINSLP